MSSAGKVISVYQEATGVVKEGEVLWSPGCHGGGVGDDEPDMRVPSRSYFVRVPNGKTINRDTRSTPCWRTHSLQNFDINRRGMRWLKLGACK